MSNVEPVKPEIPMLPGMCSRIGLKFNWVSLLSVLVVITRHGTEEGQREAYAELRKMAQAADHWNTCCDLWKQGIKIDAEQALCIGCGCQDHHLSLDGVCWERIDRMLQIGVCSACKDELARWDGGDRRLSLAAALIDLSIEEARRG